MEKRQPLSVMIALQSKKMRGGDSSPPADSNDDGGDDMAGDEGDEKYSDPGLIAACEDLIDAFKNRDAKAVAAALDHYLEFRESSGDGDSDGDDRN